MLFGQTPRQWFKRSKTVWFGDSAAQLLPLPGPENSASAQATAGVPLGRVGCSEPVPMAPRAAWVRASWRPWGELGNQQNGRWELKKARVFLATCASSVGSQGLFGARACPWASGKALSPNKMNVRLSAEGAALQAYQCPQTSPWVVQHGRLFSVDTGTGPTSPQYQTGFLLLPGDVEGAAHPFSRSGSASARNSAMNCDFRPLCDSWFGQAVDEPCHISSPEHSSWSRDKITTTENT